MNIFKFVPTLVFALFSVIPTAFADLETEFEERLNARHERTKRREEASELKQAIHKLERIGGSKAVSSVTKRIETTCGWGFNDVVYVRLANGAICRTVIWSGGADCALFVTGCER